MDFTPTSEHDLIRQTVRDFGQAEVAPIARRMDEEDMRGSITRQLYVEDLCVPDDNVVGAVGDGFAGTMRTLDAGRIAIGSLALGLAQGALDASLAYAKERKQFGKPIADNQAI